MAVVPTSSSPERPSTTRTTRSSGIGARLQTRVPSVNTDPLGAGVGVPWLIGNSNWDIGQDTTGLVPPVAEGYDVQSTQLNAARKANAMARANGFLVTQNGGPQMPMFVTATNIDTSISGSSAQSQLIQDWYPHNFVQPMINVYGISLDQEDYGTLCEFVRSCQFNGLATPATWAASMTQLVVLGSNGFNGIRGMTRSAATGARSTGRKVESQFTQTNGVAQKQLHVNQTLRGDHDTIVAKGYINEMPRIHAKFQYATLWQFDFVVAQMLAGPFRERVGVPSNLPKANGAGMWVDMVHNAQSIGVASVSAKQNKASLSYAASKSATLVNTTSTGG